MKLLLPLALLTAAPALAQGFPRAIEHRFGTATIEAPPERVATVDYNGADVLLSLGVQPVAIRRWMDFPRAVGPWADPLMTGTPVVLDGDLDLEAIAAADPDLILALYSGITAEEHARLSIIAPTVAVPEGVGDFALSWEEQARIAARATGREDVAEERIAGVHEEIAAMAARHPDWAGRTASLAGHYGDTPYVYTAEDPRVRLLHQLGFVSPPAVEALSGTGEYFVELSGEAAEPFDAELLIWLPQDGREAVAALPLATALPAMREGREVYAEGDLMSALGHSTLLSLPAVLAGLEPLIEAALDSDPATPADGSGG